MDLLHMYIYKTSNKITGKNILKIHEVLNSIPKNSGLDFYY